MTAEPFEPPVDLGTGSYEVVQRGDQASVVLPMTDFLRLRALEKNATVEALEDAEDTAAIEYWRAREAAGLAKYVSVDEARRRLGIPRQ